MKKVTLRKTPPQALEEIYIPQVTLTAQDYLQRLALLRAAMIRSGLDICLVYGDREHFANIEYLTGYDCRFEEGILLVPLEGEMTLLAGNEGFGYSMAIPFPIKRVYYRNFSLQGQPRCREEVLEHIFQDAGVQAQTRLGVIGYKYHLPEYIPSYPEKTYDLPHYVIEAIFRVCPPEQVRNATKLMTGLDEGIRLCVHSAKEIAAAEAAAARTSNTLLRLLKGLKPGVIEYRLSESAGSGFAPWCMFPLVNFGGKHVSLGLRSPDDCTALAEGQACGLCYGIRGSLSSRVGVAAHDEESMGAYRPHLMSFYGAFFSAMAAWYATLSIGCTGNDLYRAVHNIIGDPSFHVTLNPGHYIGGDEWVNSPSWDGSTHTLKDGAYFQSDIIASGTDPVRTAICEDPLILAGTGLRQELQEEYPQVYERIMARRAVMQELGFQLADEVLPLSNLNGTMFPFMLNLETAFGLEDEE